MNILIGVAFVLILGALAAAGVFMLRRPPPGADPGAPRKQMAWALAVRVALSVTLFLVVLLSWRMGWIHPTGLPLAR
jgi:hypothetical protein